MIHRICRGLLSTLLLSPLIASADGLPFNQPQPGLYTYGQPTAQHLQQARDAGITTVIDLREAGEQRGYDQQAAAEALGLRYVRLPVAGRAGINADNARALHQILGQHSGPVLLHCATSNRAGALLALRAARQQGLPASDALQLGQTAGLHMAALVEQLQQQIDPAATPQP